MGQRFLVYWSVSGGINFTVYKDMDATFKTPLVYNNGSWTTNDALIAELNQGWVLRNNLSLGFSYNSAVPINPLEGQTFSYNLQYFGGFLGGYAQFIHHSLSYSTYYNPLWKFVFALHASTEFLTPQLDGRYTNDYSDQLKFDGVYEMRGWQGISGLISGGSKIYYSGELRFQIYQDAVWGTFFTDLGNLWPTYNGFSPFNPNGYIGSFGAGIIINIPGIPIRFYMARRFAYDGQNWGLSDSKDFWTGWQPVLSIQGIF
jgi:outer membrane protein assembly factor BamA